MIKTTEFQNKLESSLQLDFTKPNNVVNYISNILIEVAEKAKIKTKRKKGQDDPPWFDKSCRKLKQDIKLLGRKIKYDPKQQTYKTQLT